MRGNSNVIKRNVEKVWGARYTLGARYLPKNTAFLLFFAVIVDWQCLCGRQDI
jgi:hypothetical protein